MKKVNLLSMFSFVLLSQGCGAEKLQSRSGYTPPKVTPEVVKNLLAKTLDDMVFVKGGSFTMGCDLGEDALRKNLEKNEPQVMKFLESPRGKQIRFWMVYGEENCSPRHKVTLDSFSIAKFEVSFREYDIFTQEAGLPFLREGSLHSSKIDKTARDDIREGDKGAITGWNQAQRYCAWLADKTGLNFSLPTEAQWEFAATSRGRYMPFATNTGYYDFGVNYYTANPYRSTEPSKDEYEENIIDSDEDEYKVNVAKYPPNPLGVYNMSGSMIEWAQDWYDPNYYKNSPERNPKGPKTGTTKVIRGGGGGGPQTHTVWVRYGWPILKTEAQVKREEKLFWNNKFKIDPESAPRDKVGMRCALNHPKPVTAKDLKVQ